MCKLGEEICKRQAGEQAARTQQMQRADRVGAAPAQWRAAIPGQRLRQDQQAIKGVGKTQGCRDPEREPRLDTAEQSAKRWP